MKKILLTIVAILLSSAFVPAAFALPVFARQTGFACNQCHFQHFPMLNAFGRSFKNSGFTMIGAQPQVEGDELSIPDRLNFGVLTTMGIENVSNPVTGGVDSSVNTPAGGGELSLFYGGRVSSNIGFLSELGTAGTAGASSAKMSMLFEVAEGTHAGLVFMTTKDQGAAHSFETLNTGAVAVHRMVPFSGLANSAHIKVNSAAQYLGTKTGAQGASFVMNNDNYFVNLGKYAVATATGAATHGYSMSMNYGRAAAMFDLAGFDSALGVQVFRGNDATVVSGTGLPRATEATIIDGQMQGAVGDMPLGVYFSYGTAPAVADSGVGSNLFNANTDTASSMNVGAEVGVIPGVATVMAAMRMGKNGKITAGSVETDNGIMLGMTYELAMNVEASLSYTAQSGTAWDAPAGGSEPAGKNVTTVMLEAVF